MTIPTLPGPLVRMTDKDRDAITDYAEGKAYHQVDNHWHRVFHFLSLVAICILAWSSYQAWHQPKERIYVEIDGTGRATVVPAASFGLHLTERLLKNQLTQFVTLHFARRKATIARDFSDSLRYLDAGLRQRVRSDFDRTDQVGKAVNTNTDSEVEVRNIVFQELRTQPYRAQADYVINTVDQNSRQTLESRTATATIEFFLVDDIPEELLIYNPIGLTITHLREDKAFVKEK